MTDFFQHGPITTIHDLGTADPIEREEALLRATARHPLALILPVTAADMRATPFELIVKELETVEFLDEIVVVLGVAPSLQDYAECLRRVSLLGDRAHVVWADGARVQHVLAGFEANGLSLGNPGKGRSVWTAYGYLGARPEITTYALHDCDIATYGRDLLVRLCLPAVHPQSRFEYVKAYYARFTDRLHGRVSRLLVAPLVRAMREEGGPNPFLEFVGSFRYPLAGEFAISSSLAAQMRIPGDWGLEIGTLAEVYRHVPAGRVCQVDLCAQYDHKHQVPGNDASEGLNRMARDIVVNLLRASEPYSAAIHDNSGSLGGRYLRHAQHAIDQYAADALLNGLRFDRHEEELLAESFARCAVECRVVCGGPRTEMASWDRVRAAVPDASDQLRAAVAADLDEHRWLREDVG